MIQAEDLIQSGYWRKHYHTVVDDQMARAHSKDTINRFVKIAEERGESGSATRDRLQGENVQMELQAHAFALRVVQVGADALTALGYTLETAREGYKS